MVWFRVDDGWHKHRKRIRAGLDLEGMAAQGLWAAAGSWCGDELSDGFIPDDVVDYLAPGVGQTLAKRLEAAKLWVRDERDGETGWAFHQWIEQQPTREEVEAVTSKKSSGGKLGNHRRWHAEAGKFDPTCPFCREDRPPAAKPRPDGEVSHRSTDRYSDGSSESGANPPTRPDPNRSETTEQDPPPEEGLFAADATTSTEPAKKPSKRGNKPATRIPDDFAVTQAMVDWAVEEVPLVDGRFETDNFLDHWRAATKNDLKRDWVAAWRTWMRRAQKDAEARGLTRRWNPTGNDQGRAGSELARRDGTPAPRRSTSTLRAEQGMAVADELDREYGHGQYAQEGQR